MHGDFPDCFGSLMSIFEQKCMNSAGRNSLSDEKNCFPALSLSPFVLSPSIYHEGLDAYAFLPRT